MIAIDTNVLVRLLVRDDDDQLARARAMLADGPVFVSLVCLLETAWVLRSGYGVTAPSFKLAFERLLEAAEINVEARESVSWALSRSANGADLADMLLVVAGRDCSKFATFDRRLQARVGPDAPIPVELV